MDTRISHWKDVSQFAINCNQPRCYGRCDILALTPAKLLLDLATQERCKAEMT